MKKLMSATVALTTAVSLSLGGVSSVLAASYKDVEGHWGEKAIAKWSDYGVVNGDGENFRPDDALTRGEFAVIISALLELDEASAANPFTDLGEKFYKDAILKCYKAGIFAGDADGKIRPEDVITREEAMVILGRALDIAPENGDLNNFSDGLSTSDWAKGYVKAFVDAGLVSGMGDNKLMPKGVITRAACMQILNNSVNTYANEDGATVTADGGTVLVLGKNVKITGNADKVIVLGATEGSNITFENAEVTGEVMLYGNNVNVGITGTSKINGVDVKEEANNTTININENVSVKGINTAAENTKIIVSGNAGSINVEESAKGTEIKAEKGAAIENVKAAADNTVISGSGDIKNAAVSGNNTKVDTNGTKLEVAKGTENVTENSKNVGEGENVTTSQTKPSGGGAGSSTSGGGSSSGGSSGGDSSESSRPTYTVTYTVDYDGKQYAYSEKIKRGKTVEMPDASVLKTTEDEALVIPENMKLTFYKDGEFFDFTKDINGNTHLEGVIGSTEFTAGNGTEEYPFLIANAGEFMNIGNYSDRMKSEPYYFTLIDDIDLSNEEFPSIQFGEYVTEAFQGVLDGGGHSLMSKQNRGIIFDSIDDVTIRDLTWMVNGNSSIAFMTAVNRMAPHDKGTVVFENVNVEQAEDGVVVTAGNNDGPYVNFAFDGELKFINCVNNADFNFTTYGALYVGGYAYSDAKVTFERCVNFGKLTGANVALFVGNPSGGPADCTVIDCANEGIVHGVESEGWFSRLYNAGTKKFCTEYDELNEKYDTDVKGNHYGDPEAPVELTVEAKDGKIAITSDSETAKNISYILVRASTHTSFKRADGTSGGSSYVKLMNRIEGSDEVWITEDEFANITRFVDDITYKAEHEDAKIEFSDDVRESYANARYVALDGGVYVFSAEDMLENQATDCTEVKVGNEITVFVDAFNENGVSLASKSITLKDLLG